MLHLRVRSMLVGLGAIVCITFGGSVAVQQDALSQMAIGSAQYKQITRSKDLVADVLPPPAYLIESYLEASLLQDNPASLPARKARLEDLKRQYLERHTFWSERAGWQSGHGVNEELYKAIVEDSHAEAMRFWDVVEKQYLPAVSTGNPAVIHEAFAKVTEVYAAHREQVDRIVALATAEQTRLEQQASADGARFGLIQLVFIAIAIAIILAGFYFMFRRVVRPIGEVTVVMKHLAAGDLRIKAPGAERRDEVGEMVQSIEVFRTKLLETERLREEQAEAARLAEIRRRESLREMALSVEAEAAAAVNSVGDQARTMMGLAHQMSGSLANVTTQCEGVAATAQQAMMTATGLTAATQQFAASIQEVSRQLGMARTATAATVETSEKTRVAVSNLAQVVSDIGDVAGLISEIADQTNLLALNATIESARAGEAGRGFAVVAAEVKTLSGQTARSTEEIRKHVVSIQAVMRETTEIVEQITSQITHVDEGSAAIAAAMEEQTATIGEISRHVEESARAAAYVSDSVSVVLGEAAKTGDGARSLSSSVSSVDQAIGRLREAIVRVVRTSSPDVERREDPRYDVDAPGLLVERQQQVTVENVSRGGALLASAPGLSHGDTGRLSLANTQVPFKVVDASGDSARLRFADAKPAGFEQSLVRLTAGAYAKQAG